MLGLLGRLLAGEPDLQAAFLAAQRYLALHNKAEHWRLLPLEGRVQVRRSEHFFAVEGAQQYREMAIAACALDEARLNRIIFLPTGNPPHKHDVQNPPAECDLDEIYYFRIDHPEGFGLLRVYDGTGRDQTVAIRDGDLALLRRGYHLVAAPPGFKVYYLAMLAGVTRNLAAATDPRYDRLKTAWTTPDPRLPLVR